MIKRMGKKGGWFTALKKALSPKKSKLKNWAEKGKKNPDSYVSSFKEITALPITTPIPHSDAAPPPPPPLPPHPPPPPLPYIPLQIGEVKLAEVEDEQRKHAYSMALATVVAAEAVIAIAQTIAEVVCLTTVAPYSGKTKEEIAAIKIQTAFRRYLARRALRALRGLVRLKSLIQGQFVKQQVTSALQSMQTLARVQSQIRARRIRMTKENQALQWQLQQKREKEHHKLRAPFVEHWGDSPQSKEQVEANLMHRQKAAMRRERALAYTFSHQQLWKNSPKSTTQTFMDPNNPQWGWSWLERWMATRPWESRSVVDNNDHGSIKSKTSRTMSLGEISRAYYRRDINHDNMPSLGTKKSSRPGSRQCPSIPPSRAPSASFVTSKTKPPSPRGSAWGRDEKSRSQFSIQSERYRRHSIEGSSVRDDESLASSPSVPSYMASTQSAKAKSRLPSPLGVDQNRIPDKSLVPSLKKRLSFLASTPVTRRHSGPPRMDATVIKDIDVHTEGNVGTAKNGT